MSELFLAARCSMEQTEVCRAAGGASNLLVAIYGARTARCWLSVGGDEAAEAAKEEVRLHSGISRC